MMKCLKVLFTSIRNRADKIALRLHPTNSKRSTATDKKPLHGNGRPYRTLQKQGLAKTEKVSTLQTDSSIDTLSTSSNDSTSTLATEDTDYVWGPIKSIPDRSFINLVLRHFDPDGELGGVGAFVSRRCSGAFNHVVMVTFIDGGTYVVKVPAAGWDGNWTQGDACNLRSEACTMNYFRQYIPVPGLIAYDTSMDNEISAPYILMDYLDGHSAMDIWYERDEDGDWINDEPSPERVQKRTTFLKSLAKTMSKLQGLTFDKIGMLDFTNDTENPSVVPLWREKQSMEFTDAGIPIGPRREMYPIPVYESSKQYWSAQLRKEWPKGQCGGTRCDGVVKIVEHMLDELPFSTSKASDNDTKESFVIGHYDLNLQNILTDAEGHVTGIIDWECAGTLPRCVGFSSAPVFLQEDWTYEYSFPDSGPSPMALASYRKIYTDAMIEAMGGQGDCVYTAKSDIYTALHWALYGNGTHKLPDVIDKVVGDLLGPRFLNHTWFEEKLGEGEYEDGENALEQFLPAYLAPF